MPVRAMTMGEVARELGWSYKRFREGWRQLVNQEKLPAPLLGAEPPRWSAAQMYAFLDKKLTKQQRAAAAAYRAAFEAASAPDASLLDQTVSTQTAALEARYMRA